MKISTSEDAPLFAERPEWADVQPLEQYENANPIAPIFYTEEYKDATNYFRAIVRANEKTHRVLDLTENIIRQNPAHYSAWQYRYETLLCLLPAETEMQDGLPRLLGQELALMDELAVLFLKTYQVWHHRRLLVQLTKQPTRELSFIKKGLQVDAKNYHTWSYRQWLLASCYGPGAVTETDEDEDELLVDQSNAVWAAELDFIDTMLVSDVRNNSAWHHRFFVVFECGDGSDRAHVLRRELVYAKQSISLAPNNPSAWNYLRGVLSHTGTPFASQRDFARLYAFSRSGPVRRDIVDLDNPPPSDDAELPCVHAMEFLADILEIEGVAKAKTGPQEAAQAIEQAVEIWKKLAYEQDSIRKRYWVHRIRDAHQSLVV
ncbi:hypothetical protein D9619_009721 [Psilocybe cf. subviscida]|uniref:Protein farnesyltransferase/geranylgeranyltransferase type-1 subunit alpha n=1 Tax=Psilocybe cf. subviscida TaxID=2480587 RepID=A0A8H5BNN8_9AGAR|nr:hypothetical protein D9619_009721 [Psilocybe cf. subviscida]